MEPKVREALAEARAFGFLGPGPVEEHIEHSLAFAEVVGAPEGRSLDLGSGGGVPGLILAGAFPRAAWVLLDVSRRRTSFLSRWVALLGWMDRVQVVRGAAEVLAHDLAFRESFVCVTARSFGPPPVTAETATGFLAVGGRLIVAEPPAPSGDDDRWSVPGLDGLGFGAPAVALRRRRSFVTITKRNACGPGSPRTRHAMERRPAW